MMQSAIQVRARLGQLTGKKSVRAQQVNEGNASQTSAEAPEEFPAIQGAPILGAQNKRPLF
jgi:hypothetical protein